MNTNNSRRYLIAAMAIFSVLPLAAQPPGRPSDGGNRLDFLAGYLSLSETQRTQAQAIFTAAETAGETARGQLEAARTSLNTAIKANATDAELDRLSAAMGVIHGQMTAIQAKASAKFYALLTAEQKTKYDELMNRGPGNRPVGGPGGR
ncbi:MAG: Spy/CpxP family protein refolding chaperone [Bryobacterales bacterium]|nr:Spy/CpxP family protein refolding chaperone [Bryobacterales bacterium]